MLLNITHCSSHIHEYTYKHFTQATAPLLRSSPPFVCVRLIWAAAMLELRPPEQWLQQLVSTTYLHFQVCVFVCFGLPLLFFDQLMACIKISGRVCVRACVFVFVLLQLNSVCVRHPGRSARPTGAVVHHKIIRPVVESAPGQQQHRDSCQQLASLNDSHQQLAFINDSY